MATPVVLTTGARPIVPVESGGVPMTPVDTLGEPVTVVDTLGEPVVLINNDGTPAFLAYSAKTYLGGVAPYHWLDFINNRALYAGADVGNVTQATGYSFTRASTGYYTNADGTLTLFGSGALRRGDRGVLIEGSRTNLLVRSQEFDNAAWAKSNTTVTADAIAAPDGALTADLIVPNATSGAHFINNNAVVGSAAAHTITLFCKPGGYSRVGIREQTSTGTEAVYVLSGAGSVLTTTGSPVADIVLLADGWYMIRFTMTLSGASSFRFYVLDGSYTSGNLNSYAWSGDTTSGVYFWQADLQAGAFPSSSIVTVAAAATRAADVLTYTAGVSYPIQLWSEFERAVDTGAAETLLAIDNGTNNERVNLGLSAGDLFNLVLVKNAGGVDSVNTTVGSALSTGVTYKGATRVATNAVRPAFGGTLGTEDTAIDMPLAPTTIRIGANASGSQPFGYIRRIAIIQGAGTDAQLQSMTGS